MRVRHRAGDARSPRGLTAFPFHWPGHGAVVGTEPDNAAGDPAATVTVCDAGPLLLRGDFEILDQDGDKIDPGRSTVALCRCGRSAVKPFCDGTHKTTPARARRNRPGAAAVRSVRRP